MSRSSLLSSLAEKGLRWCCWGSRPSTFAFRQAPLLFTDRLLLGDPALFAGRDKPAFAPYGAEHLAARHFLAEALQQRALGLSGP